MTDLTGIEQEEEARQLEMEILTSPITFLGEDEKAVKISGIALTEGVWKNVIYSAAEIQKKSNALLNKPLIVEHGKTKEFGDREVGHITSSYWEPTLKAIIFEALVTDPLAKELVKKGVLPAVSCSTWMEKKAVNDTIRIGYDYNFAELSLVRIPACDRCFIFHKEQLSKLPLGKDLKVIEEKNLIKEEIIMTPEEIETLSEVEMEEQALKAIEELENPKLFAILELPDEESLESLRQTKRVVSYYYGHPNYAPFSLGYGNDFPYYGHPYKRKLSEEEPILLAVVELDSKEDLIAMRKTYRVKGYYYGRYGYPYHGYPYYGYPHKKSDLTAESRVIGEQLPEVQKPITDEGPIKASTPNPEACAKVTCPVCDKEFDKPEDFQAHWDKEHKEKYGDFKEMSVLIDVLGGMVDLAKGDTKIIKTKTGRFVVFKDTGKVGFGQWKILGNFATEKEAKEAAGKKEEKAAEEEKDEHGCIIGKEEWCEDEKKCMPLKKEEQSAYTDFVAKCMKEGKSMKECAANWKKEKMAVEEFICPACKKKFASEKELIDHWTEKHKVEYGKIYKGYKKPEEKAYRYPYYYYRCKGRYYPYYYHGGKYYKYYKGYPAPKK